MIYKHGALDEVHTRIANLRAEAKARGEALLEEVRGRGDEILKEAQVRGQRAVKDSKLWIIENPARAVGIAFIAGAIVSSAGVIASMLLRPRGSTANEDSGLG